MNMFSVKIIKILLKEEVRLIQINLKESYLQTKFLKKEIKKLIAAQVLREQKVSLKASLSIIIASKDCQAKEILLKLNYAKIP